MFYNLICEEGHETVGEYASIAAFEKTRAHGFLECATCLTTSGVSAKVRQGLSAPRLNTSSISSGRDGHKNPNADTREFVGKRLFDVAVAISRGEEPDRPVCGSATDRQVGVMRELGFEVTPQKPYKGRTLDS